MDINKVAENILNIRKENNLSQSEFASRLNVTNQAVSKWENKRGIPDIETMLKISKEFDISLDEIINGKKYKPKTNKVYILLIALIIIVLSFCVYLLTRENNISQFASITTVKDSFSLRGFIVQNKTSASIYISNITCNDTISEEEKYLAVEMMLYEDLIDDYKIISKYGNLDKNENNKAYSLQELINEVELVVEDFENKCPNIEGHNYIILLNALTKDEEVVSYKLPLSLTSI